MVITTEQEKYLANHQKILVLHGEDELKRLVENVKVFLLGKEANKKIVAGVDTGVAVG
jgi:butyrate kinase